MRLDETNALTPIPRLYILFGSQVIGKKKLLVAASDLR